MYLSIPAELQCLHSEVWQPGNEASFISTRPKPSFLPFFLSCSMDLCYMSDTGLDRVKLQPRSFPGFSAPVFDCSLHFCILQAIKNYLKQRKGWERGQFILSMGTLGLRTPRSLNVPGNLHTVISSYIRSCEGIHHTHKMLSSAFS